MTEENATPEVKAEANKEPTLADKLKETLGQFDGAPAPETITGWKEVHGDVYVSAFSEDEVFIFRSLNRAEYRGLQEQAAEGTIDSMEYEELTVKTCLLWGSVTDLSGKAGTIPSLQEMVMQNSNFVPPQLASQLVAKL